MSDNQAEQENAYKKYSIRSEHALMVTASTDECDTCKTRITSACECDIICEIEKSSLWIEGKTWEFTYEYEIDSFIGELQLEMLKKNSSAAGDNKTTAEIIFWYWNNQKEIVILHQEVHDDFSNLSETTPSQLPVNKKFNAVIRLLDKRNEDGKDSLLESYFGNFGKLLEMVILRTCGTNGQTGASFTVPKVDLVRASPVFHRMFTAEMTEKATGEVKIEDTNAEEFGDFLKAISPKQEHPNPSNVLALLKLADRYECQSLIDRCEAHLMNCIEIPIVERINIADSYGLKDLKENLLMHFEGTGTLELYRDAKPHRDLHQALDKLVE